MTEEAKPDSGEGEGVKGKRKSHLTLWIVISIVAALVLALLAPHFAMKLHVGGEVFLRLLKMMVVPLVVTSVMTGVLGMGDVRKLGKPGAGAIGYYFATTVLAVLVGLIVVNVIQPGVGALDEAEIAEMRASAGPDSPKERMLESLAEVTGLSKEEVGSIFEELPEGEPEVPTVGKILKNLMLMLVTDNLFLSAVETNLLPLIIFSIIFAGMLTTMGSRVATLTELVGQANHALMGFIMLLMKVAPLGIFCLVAARFGEAQAEGEFVEVLQQTGYYVLAVLAGLSFHVFVTLPTILWVFTRRNPLRFTYAMSQALLTAFSTASSSATLPVTMECAEKKAGVSKTSMEFVLPLGATINMDGTALYEAVAAIFIAQVLGFELTLLEQATVAVTATLAAIGAAGIPEAGLVTMLIVLNAVGLPTELIVLILPVDWLLDRFRTAANVFGDAVGAAVVERLIPERGSGTNE
jgi:solute carrier family 1 (high affinity glutamate transporter) protein 1